MLLCWAIACGLCVKVLVDFVGTVVHVISLYHWGVAPLLLLLELLDAARPPRLRGCRFDNGWADCGRRCRLDGRWRCSGSSHLCLYCDRSSDHCLIVNVGGGCCRCGGMLPLLVPLLPQPDLSVEELGVA